MSRPAHVLLPLLALLAFAVGAHAADGRPPGADLATGPTAYQQPLAALAEDLRPLFREGAGVFRQAWLAGPSADTPRFTGLGPLYNRRSCIACHIGNGRGAPPAGDADILRSTLVRISLPGADATGGPRPHPVYGDQIQTDAVLGRAPEAAARLRWRETPVTLDDGTVVRLRRPEIALDALNYGPLPETLLTSARLSPAVFGLGLLEAVSAETLHEMAHAETGDGVRGRVNMVWDIARRRAVPGRFGLKANQPSLRQQVAAALAGDMGITSALIPREDCPLMDCGGNGRAPEIADADFTALVRYMAALAPPPRRPMDAAARKGARLFAAAGCAACHRETLRTGPSPDAPETAHRTIHPYTDLLLHDMGAGLADGRPDFAAGGRDWRTAPLWGLGLAGEVSGAAPVYLHDGRARTLTEAILWHGGEAQAARDMFAALPRPARAALLAFLGTL